MVKGDCFALQELGERWPGVEGEAWLIGTTRVLNNSHSMIFNF